METRKLPLSHANAIGHLHSPCEPSSNLGELDFESAVHLEAEATLSKKDHLTTQKRIPEGTVTGEIPLEAAKAYPTRIWTGTGTEPRIAYADLNTHGERNTLSVKLLPDGGKTAPHPQIVLFVNGPYHVEELGYARSDAWRWTTWMEVHLDAQDLDKMIDALIRAKLKLEAVS